MSMFKAIKILTMRVNVVSISDMISWVESQCKKAQGSYVCVSNVHMCMECYDGAEFNQLVNDADVTVPDGLPLVWAQKLLGAKETQQVRGMDLMLNVCEMAAAKGLKVGFYGGDALTLDLLKKKLSTSYTALNISCLISPPFRELSAQEDSAYISKINSSGVQILFVGIGCPKQEYWMANHKDSLSCVMFGVGAAFDFIAGQKKHAPKWMQTIGLEWLFRFINEPRRLWKRYLKHNPRFVLYFSWQLFKKRLAGITSYSNKS